MNLQKHKVLKVLYAKERTKDYQPYYTPPELIKEACLSPEQLKQKSRLKYEDLEVICYALINEGHIQIVTDEQAKPPKDMDEYYLITLKGKKALMEKEYLLKMPIATYQFWFSLSAMIISIVAIVVSFFKD
jgi:hypothetical protein